MALAKDPLLPLQRRLEFFCGSSASLTFLVSHTTLFPVCQRCAPQASHEHRKLMQRLQKSHDPGYTCLECSGSRPGPVQRIPSSARPLRTMCLCTFQVRSLQVFGASQDAGCQCLPCCSSFPRRVQVFLPTCHLLPGLEGLQGPQRPLRLRLRLPLPRATMRIGSSLEGSAAPSQRLKGQNLQHCACTSLGRSAPFAPCARLAVATSQLPFVM